VVRCLAWQWFIRREPQCSGRAIARKLGVSHTYIQKLSREFAADPEGMLEKASRVVRHPTHRPCHFARAIHMRTFLGGILFGCVVASVQVARPQADSPRETINVGSDMTLGMTEDTAVKRLSESGYKLKKITPPDGLREKGITTMWAVQESGDKGRNLGIVLFSSGKLTFAQRDLLPVEGDDVQFGRQLYFALRDLESEGDFRCTISTESAQVPEFSHKSAKVKCGKKALVIDLRKSQKQSEVVQLNEELDAR